MKRSITYIHNKLKSSYSYNEINSLIELIFNHIYNYSKKDFILQSDKVLTNAEFERIKEIADQLYEDKPIQHLFGKAHFYDLQFTVNKNVLIPRQETEELVDLILKKHGKQEIKILDIGAGSGCIPIALKKNNPLFTVVSCDISDEALSIARENAISNQASINFLHFDILSDDAFPEKEFDVIVSNPPYIAEKEKSLMPKNVLDHDPHLALFVSNEDPLVFYRAILQQSIAILKSNGYVYFEINEAYGSSIKELMEQYGYACEIIKDLNGKDRMAVGYKQ